MNATRNGLKWTFQLSFNKMQFRTQACLLVYTTHKFPSLNEYVRSSFSNKNRFVLHGIWVHSGSTVSGI